MRKTGPARYILPLRPPGRDRGTHSWRKRMDYTWEDLRKMPVKKLREIAEELGDRTESLQFSFGTTF